MNNYKLQAPYEPNGDQPEAIKKLVHGVNNCLLYTSDAADE